MAINVSGHCNGAAITSSAKTFSDLSVTVPSGAACFIGRVEDAAIRVRSDGSSATSSTGVLLKAGETWETNWPIDIQSNISAIASSPHFSVINFQTDCPPLYAK